MAGKKIVKAHVGIPLLHLCFFVDVAPCSICSIFLVPLFGQFSWASKISWMASFPSSSADLPLLSASFPETPSQNELITMIDKIGPRFGELVLARTRMGFHPT